MNKYKKTAWEFAVISNILMGFFIIFNANPSKSVFLLLSKQFVVFSLFLFGYYKNHLIPAALALIWLLLADVYSCLKLLQHLTTAQGIQDFREKISGLLAAITLMLVWTYYAVRAFLSFISDRYFSKSTRI